MCFIHKIKSKERKYLISNELWNSAINKYFICTIQRMESVNIKVLPSSLCFNMEKIIK